MQSSYDYIVVGSGSSGSVVAARLSEDPSCTVLLLEAGGSDKSLKVVMPALGQSTMYGDPSFDWRVTAEPDWTRVGQKDYMPKGKLLGGTSSINAMCFLRGSAEDFDAWAALGNRGWDYASVLPYFRRLETYEVGESQARGASGPQPVGALRSRHPMSDIFVKACVNHGAPFLDDVNGGSYEGVGFAQVSQRRGQRFSAARSFLWPASKRPNLRIQLNSLAQRVLFEGRKAVGVEVIRNNRPESVLARKGIVLSSGVFGTPQILMLSGIGPAEMLRQHGIDVLIDAPGVGQNLQDHAGTRHVAWVDIKTFNMIRGPFQKLMAGLEWLVYGTGPASSPMTQAVLAKKLDSGDDRSRFSVLFTPGGYELHAGGTRFLDKPAVTAIINVHRPHSSGHVELRSSDCRDQLKIQPNLFGDERDVATLMKGHRAIREVFDTEPLRSHVLGEYRPGVAIRSDDELGAYIKETAKGIFHTAGTARMGSVVDDRLRVNGVAGLFVADASVMPFVVSSNLNATCMMIGERLAEWLASGAR
ncbi:GMC family oxidoreductase N-terminal domain-containing protein [Bosea sp. F3-2]|uniref:GMC family oxidoreductase n=1 Tax=Bosea sp. F3-2 TaxID=2599640 RepID=UPI001654C308|nr:GMC family oxidoreductase N-terminal domain-containing protein [Bosea sp. F3-2]